jgi:Leucine-rich repeat (LRR) protein
LVIFLHCLFLVQLIFYLKLHRSKLVRLEYFDFHGNELKQLPTTFLNCTSLKTLNLNGNALVKLPDLLGTLPCLLRLDVAANRLTIVPLSLGYSKTLKELVVEDNPLVDPPIEEMVKGFEHFKWYMRSRLQVGISCVDATEIMILMTMTIITFLPGNKSKRASYICVYTMCDCVAPALTVALNNLSETDMLY